MEASDSSAPMWVESLCRIPSEYYEPGAMSIRDLFSQASPEVDNPRFVKLVRTYLEHRPDLLHAWQQYSYDKRGTPSPFLDGLKVGFVSVIDGKQVVRDVRIYESAVEACAQFIRRESSWVLEGRELA